MIYRENFLDMIQSSGFDIRFQLFLRFDLGDVLVVPHFADVSCDDNEVVEYFVYDALFLLLLFGMDELFAD